MRKESPLVACIAAALVLVTAGALSLPLEVWCAGPSVLRLAPSLLATTVAQGHAAAGALRTGVLSAPALFHDRALEPSRPEHPVRVCQGDDVGSCPQSECARVRILRRIPVLVPTSG